VLSVAGEAWHAAAHLRLSTHAGPIAEAFAMLGPAVVVIAVWLAGRRPRGRADDGSTRAGRPEPSML